MSLKVLWIMWSNRRHTKRIKPLSRSNNFTNDINFIIGEVFYLVHCCFMHNLRCNRPARKVNIILPTYLFTEDFKIYWFKSIAIRHKNGDKKRKDITLRKSDLKLKNYISMYCIGTFYTSPNIVYSINGTL